MSAAAFAFLSSYVTARQEAKTKAETAPAATTETAPAAPAAPAGNINPVDAETVASSVKKPPSSGGGSGGGISAFKVPMGITGLLIFILFVLFAIKPAAGHSESRLMLLWNAIYKGGSMASGDALAENTNGMAAPTSAAAYVDPVMRYV